VNNSVKVKFQTLLAEKKPFLGTFIQSAAPEFVEAAGYAGFRFAAVDLEHTYYGVEKTAEMIRAGEAADMAMLARVPALDAIWIKKSLDLGASGIIVPNIDTAEQAAQAVRLCRFTPEGVRGACPGVRANRYGAGGPEYYDQSNRDVAVMALVESPEGVKNFDAIVRTPGLTAVFLGPVDLSVAMGLKGNIAAPEVQEALLDMIRRANAAGVPVGALGLDPGFARRLFAQGLTFLAYGIDTILMYQTCRNIMKSVFDGKESRMTNEVLKTLKERRSIRGYQPQQIAQEELDAILEAGTYAPSGMGKQPVTLVAVQDPETIAQLSRMNAQIMGTASDPFYGAPTVILVLADPERPTCVEDGALAMGNLMNAAASLGVGSCWIHRAREEFESPEGKALLKKWGLPENLRGVGHCVLGYAAAPAPAAAPRRAGDVVLV